MGSCGARLHGLGPVTTLEACRAQTNSDCCCAAPRIAFVGQFWASRYRSRFGLTWVPVCLAATRDRRYQGQERWPQEHLSACLRVREGAIFSAWWVCSELALFFSQSDVKGQDKWSAWLRSTCHDGRRDGGPVIFWQSRQGMSCSVCAAALVLGWAI